MISGLYTALSGMNAHRRILDVTSHNVANQSTEGFRRQRVDLAPAGIGSGAAVFTGGGSQLGGVDIVGTRRVVDELTETRAVQAQAASSDAATTSEGLARIEAVFPEPSDFGLAAQFDEFWSTWSDLANRPDDHSARAAVLDQAESLTGSLGRAAGDLDDIATTSTLRLGRIAEEVNDLAGRIAELNTSIAASSTTPNDLFDQRHALVTDLATLVGATTRESVGGQIDVSIGGRALVTGPMTQSVTAVDGTLRWERGGDAVKVPPSEAAALQRLVGETLPSQRARLDAVADSLVTEVNALHSTGYDLDGATGRTFFDPAGTSAASISLSADVAGDPRRLAAGAPVFPGPTAPGPVDGSMADRLARLADSPTGPDAGYRAFVTQLGVDTRSAGRRAETQQMVADRALDDVDVVSGVSIDEEMVNLIQAQRGYEANARVLTAIDAMLGTLIERTGLVGR